MLIAGVLLAVVLLVVPQVYAFNFEDFQWGAAYDQVKEQLGNKGKNILSSSGTSTLVYSDSILEEPCMVTLMFTPLTKVLASVEIFWNKNYMGEDVKELLRRKYGDPYQPNLFIDEYYWQGASEYDALVLEYGYVGTKLSYYGGAYQQRYEEETRELIDVEIDRF